MNYNHLEFLRNILWDYFKLADIRQEKDLYHHCIDKLKSYYKDVNSNKKRDRLIDCISLYLIGMAWPKYNDTNHYKMTFNRYVDSYRQSNQIGG
ncbi:MAG TPA: hypothetical protein VLG50_05205 [Candidatus Saccharimonadales bacterium]|nr:hypothetical protein [Candidatus Saccharimonadales bacterium]